MDGEVGGNGEVGGDEECGGDEGGERGRKEKEDGRNPSEQQ